MNVSTMAVFASGTWYVRDFELEDLEIFLDEGTPVMLIEDETQLDSMGISYKYAEHFK